MSTSIRKYEEGLNVIFLLVFSAISSNLFSQSDTKNDTVIIAPTGSYVQVRDSVAYFSKDSVIWVPSGADPYIINENKQANSFYDSLRIRAARSNLTKRLYDIVIITPDNSKQDKIEVISDENYLGYSGLKIRNIEVKRLNVFGSNINDPAAASSNLTTNILNKTHINTTERIIRNNLLFETGDTISPLTLSDNERLLRELQYIDDARIFVVPVSYDEADVIVVTKDVYSFGLNYDYRGLKKGNLTIFNKNIMGSGHMVEFTIPFDFEESNSPGFGFNYSINNIKRSFVNLNSFYFNGLGIETFGFGAERPLVASTTKYAAGISVSKMSTNEDLDTMQIAAPLRYTLQDYWVLRSFLLNSSSVKRIIIGARYYNNNIFERPLIFENSFHNLQKYKVFLGSISYSKQKYYKTNLIYAYGRTEDLPFGGLIRITAGQEINEFKNRTYLSFDASIGQSVPNFGYLFANVAIGGYMYKNEPEQG